MANVIPREGLSKMQKRNSARFLLLGSFIFATAAVIAILAILPAYVSVRIARAAVDSAMQDSTSAGMGTEQAAAVRTQTLITNLTPIANATSSPTDTLSVALSLRPAGISITTITYTGGSKSSILLTGTSERREAVTAFRDALQASGRFSNVAVPVAALVGTQEGRFTITLSN
jgi:Tfp pilus assembly protein PilN